MPARTQRACVRTSTMPPNDSDMTDDDFDPPPSPLCSSPAVRKGGRWEGGRKGGREGKREVWRRGKKQLHSYQMHDRKKCITYTQ